MARTSAGFNAQVYDVVCRVPFGRVTTYGDVAATLGNPRLARQVGWALAGLLRSDTPDVPWQRVINAQGRISGRGETWRADEQLRLLQSEGIAFNNSGRCDLSSLRCTAEELTSDAWCTDE